MVNSVLAHVVAMLIFLITPAQLLNNVSLTYKMAATIFACPNVQRNSFLKNNVFRNAELLYL